MIGGSPTLTPTRAANYAVPLVTLLVATFMMPLPLAIKIGGAWLMPSLPMLVVFLWGIHRPDLLPSFAVALVGLLLDLLIHAPLGCSSLALVVVYAVTVSQRLYWMTVPGGLLVGFVIAALLGESTSWLANSFAYGRFLSPVPALLEGFMSVLVFPLVSRLFLPLQRLAGPPV
jgi:rod shape-determining protein MreD